MTNKQCFEDDDATMMVFVCAALLELQERRKSDATTAQVQLHRDWDKGDE